MGGQFFWSRLLLKAKFCKIGWSGHSVNFSVLGYDFNRYFLE